MGCSIEDLDFGTFIELSLTNASGDAGLARLVGF